MWPLRGVVVGFDGSADARAALDWATIETQRRGASLTVVHASDDIAVIPGPWPRRASGRELDVYSVASDGAARALRALPPRTREVVGVTCAGDPASVLSVVATDAEMLVVGAGRSRRRGRRISPVTWEVVNHAPCPVVVVSARSAVAPEAGGRVVAGVDGSAPGFAAVRFAADMAALAHAKLHLVTAYRGPGHRAAWEQLVAAEAAVQREYPDLPVLLEAVEGDPADVLADAGAQADLVVVGRHELPGDAEATRPDVTRGVLLHAPCPVAVVASPR
jgi:nucleotide-binding universal stress UspA family protein